MEATKHLRIIFVGTALVLGYLIWMVLPSVITNKDITWFYIGICLAFSGFVLGFLEPRSAVLLASTTVLPVIILSTGEMFLGIGAHNLFGIEIFMYVLLSIPAVIAAMIGKLLRTFISRRRTTAALENEEKKNWGQTR